MIFIAILLFLGAIWGWVALRHFGLSQIATTAFGGLALSMVVHLTVLNTALRLGFNLRHAHLTSFAMFALTFAILKTRSKPLRQLQRSTTRLEAVVLAFSAFVVWVSTNASQLGLSDQDFWIHTPLQRFLLDGQFPPVNPYFPELELHGHYARDLLIVSTSWISGWDVFRSQMMVTSFCQTLALLVLYFGLRETTKSRLQAALATTFVYLGTNTAYRAGWIDEFVGHSALSHLHWTVMLLFFGLWFRQKNWQTAIVFGLLLGSHGFVFTTTFGTAFVSTFLTVLALQRCKRTLQQMAAMLILALLIAGFQGGAFSDLFQTVLRAQPAKAQALRNQSQAVMIGFPKAHFLSIAKHTSDKSRSSIYNYFPANKLYSAIDHNGVRYTEKYAPLWSWDFLKLHWLPLFLAPIFGFWLLKERHPLGVFCWFFGLVSFLTPGILDFGPVQENDWFRWVIWTGSGFAASLGIALGSWYERSNRKVLVRLSVLILIWLNVVVGVRYLVVNVPENIRYQGGLAGVFTLSMTTDEWLLRYGPYLELQPVDLKVFQWFHSQGVSGQRVLVNFDPAREWDIQFESALSGYTGLRCLGHQLPLDSDRIGRPPSRMTPLAHSLLHFPEERALRTLAPDWLFLRLDDPNEVAELLELPGLKVRLQEVGRDGRTRMVIEVEEM